MELDPSKLDLLCLANELYSPSSLCDIGGGWGVDGGYGVYAKTVLGIENVKIVDSHWTDKAMQCCNDSGVKIVDSFIDKYLNKNSLQNLDCVCLFHFLRAMINHLPVSYGGGTNCTICWQGSDTSIIHLLRGRHMDGLHPLCVGHFWIWPLWIW